MFHYDFMYVRIPKIVNYTKVCMNNGKKVMSEIYSNHEKKKTFIEPGL